MRKTPSKPLALLVRPALQFRLLAGFGSVALIGLFLQTMHVGLRLSRVPEEALADQPALAAALEGIAMEALALGLLVYVPVCIVTGLAMTGRMLRPLQRIESFLRQVASETPTPVLEENTNAPFSGLAAAANEATRNLRQGVEDRPSETNRLRAAG